MTRVLILGGTADASSLADAVAALGLDATYSYGGRTERPRQQPLRTRIGGFGGVDGLVRYIEEQRITHVVDATHPFAAAMSHNAVAACRLTDTPLIALERAPWTRSPHETWIEVADEAAAVAALPEQTSRVFLAIGRQHLMPFRDKPQHVYTLRFVDPPARGGIALDGCHVIVSRGPFTLAGDLDLLRSREIEWIVARNSGGDGARAKIDAARELGIPVVMIMRPSLPARECAETVGQILAWLGHDTRLGA